MTTTTTAQPIVVIKAATDSNPPLRPRDLTPSDFIEIDPRGEAMLLATCVDCEVPVQVNPKTIEPDEDDVHQVAPMCAEHHSAREVWAAIDIQREVEMAKRRERAAQPSFFSLARAAAMNGVPVTVVPVTVAAEPVRPGAPANTRRRKKDRVDAYMALGLSRSAAKALVNS